MSDIAIRVEGLGKQYRIGGPQQVTHTFREAMLQSVSAPLRWLRGERNLAETFWALDNVSFEIEQGKAVGIIGRNGAGKSTLLKILSRITKPTKGRVDLYGRVASLLEVGTGFHSELSGRDNIYLNGAILGMSRKEIDRKFDEIVDFSDVEKFLDTPVKHYSSGMYMRLAFAIAAHLEPEILVVDEVLAVGDAEFQKKCLGKMGEVAHEGRTVLFVSHNMNAIEQLCSQCILLSKGKLLRFDADVRRVINGYLFSDEPTASLHVWNRTDSEYDNPYFSPVSLKLVDKAGHPLDMVSNSDEMHLQIEGEISVVDPALTIGVAVYNEENELLFWSYQTDKEEKSWPTLKIGKWILRTRFPARFLNEGMYRIEIIGGLHFRKWLFEPGHNVPHIFFKIQGGLSDSPYWMIRRPGLLAPVLAWDSYEVH